MRWTFRMAKQLVGLPEDFEIKSEETLEFALSCWKEETVKARNAGLDDIAADLSQAKEVFKKRYTWRVNRRCPDCERPKSAHAMRCQVCSRSNRFFKDKIMTQTPIKEHELEVTPVVIPPRTLPSGELTKIMRKLANEGKTGDSFVTGKHSTVVKAVGRILGLDVICRLVNADERDPKKRKYRVWRADGLEMEAVNKIIVDRLAGKPVPPTPPCHPPTPEELQKLKARHHGKPGRPSSK